MDTLYVDTPHHDDENDPTHPEVYGLDGSDIYVLGGNQFTTAYGGHGADSIKYVGPAFAHIYGGEGNDMLDGGKLGDDLYGGDGDDFLFGDPHDDNHLIGGSDYLDGGRGNDHLFSDPGADMLAGGLGVDTFHLAKPGAKGAPVDTILDFKPGVDILLVPTVFYDAVPEAPFDSTAPLARGKFFLGGKAKDKGDRLGYNPKNGELLYDPNGSKKGQKVVIAELSEGLKVTHDDFLVAS